MDEENSCVLSWMWPTVWSQLRRNETSRLWSEGCLRIILAIAVCDAHIDAPDRTGRHATDIYVDDFLIARTSLRWIEDSVSFSEEFGINDLGDHELLSGASADCNHEL